MPSLTSDNQIGILIKSTADTRGITQTGESLDELGGISKKNAVIMGAVAGVVQNVFSRAMNVASDSISGAIRRVDTLKNAQRTFENIGFSSTDTAKSMETLKSSILGLPTPLDAAVRGMTALASTYGDIKQGQKVFTALNNAVLGFGGSADMVNNAVLQLSQLPMDGPLDAQTWNSLRNSGLTPVLVAMAKDMGISVDVMKERFGEGELKVKDFTEALVKMNDKGGGGMKSLSQIAKDATGGIGTGIENAKTAVVRGMAKVLEAIGSANISRAISRLGSAFEDGLAKSARFVSSAIDAIRDAMEYLSPKVETLTKSIGDELMPILEDLWRNIIEPLIPVLGVLFVGAIGLVVDIVTLLLEGLGWLYQKLEEGNPIIVGLAGVFGALAAAMAFNAVFNALTVGFETLRLITLPNAMASVTALKTLIMSPTIMGAIGIGAALAAILIVKSKLDELRADIEKINGDTRKAVDSSYNAHAELIRLTKTGTAEQKARAWKAINAGYSSGGYTGRGGMNEVAGVVHKGEYVIPKSGVDQATGMPKPGVTNNRSVSIQNVILANEGAGRGFWGDIDQDATLISQGLTPLRGFK